MQPFDAGTLDGQPVRFYPDLHGPVDGYATVKRAASGGVAQALELSARRR